MALQWNRIGVRVISVGLLAAGVAGGVYLGQDRELRQPTSQSDLMMQGQVEELQLVKRQHGEHAAARAYQREAETEAATKAAVEARAVAVRAKSLDKAVKNHKEQVKKAADNATVPYAGPIPTSCNQYSGNRAIGCALMLDAGFGIAEFPCLEKIWTKESGWNHRAENKSSGAYGIPQAYPGNKMSTVADDWKTNPATQIKWGLGYVKKRYHSPCGAWSYWSSHHSY